MQWPDLLFQKSKKSSKQSSQVMIKSESSWVSILTDQSPKNEEVRWHGTPPTSEAKTATWKYFLATIAQAI